MPLIDLILSFIKVTKVELEPTGEGRYVLSVHAQEQHMSARFIPTEEWHFLTEIDRMCDMTKEVRHCLKQGFFCRVYDRETNQVMVY